MAAAACASLPRPHLSVHSSSCPSPARRRYHLHRRRHLRSKWWKISRSSAMRSRPPRVDVLEDDADADDDDSDRAPAAAIGASVLRAGGPAQLQPPSHARAEPDSPGDRKTGTVVALEMEAAAAMRKASSQASLAYPEDFDLTRLLNHKPRINVERQRSFALHLDGGTFFVSATSRRSHRSGTFSLDVERLEWI